MRKKIWHLSKKTTIWLYRLLETFVALFLVVVSLAFWKLYTEPMDAKFMLPTLAQELLPKDSKYSLDVNTAVLSADFQKGGLFHLNMRGLQLIRPDKTVAIDLPVVNLSYGLWHVLTLNYIPDKLTIERPDIRVVIDQEGHWHFQKEEDLAPQKTAKSLGLPDMKRIVKHMLSFDNITITDGILLIDDLAKKENLSLPQFELHLKKRYGFNHVMQLNAVAQVADHLTDIQAKATYSRFLKNLNLEMGISPIYISRYGRFLSLLEGVDIPVSFSLSADFKISSKYSDFLDSLQKLKFQIKTLKEGTLTLPSPIYALYPIKSAEINGAVSAGFKTLKIAESKVLLQNKTQANLEVVAKGLNQFFKDYNAQNIKTSLKATVLDVPMEDVPKVWPKEQGTNAHTWVQEHLSQGQVKNADFNLSFDGGELKDVLGTVYVTGATVDYLKDMPTLKDVSAEVILTPNEVRINADKGAADKISLTNASLVFDLQKDISDLSILLDLDGPISQMLQAINKKPLKLLEGINFDWNKIKGNAQTRVNLFFPLDEKLLVPNLKVDVAATTENISLSLPKIPLTLDGGKALLSVNNKGLQLEGEIFFQNQPLSFIWNEDFTPVKGTNSSYEIKGTLTSRSLNKIVPDIEGYLSGSFDFTASAQRLAPDRFWQGTASVDLKDAKTILYPIAVTKQKNDPALLNLILEKADSSFKSGKGSFVLNKNVENAKISMSGHLTWGNNWEIALDSVKAPANQFSALISKVDNTFTLNATGKRWNLSQLKEMPLFQKKSTSIEKTLWVPHISLKAELDKLMLHPKKTIEKVIINGERENNKWKYFQVEANAQEPFVIVYNPQEKIFHGEFSDLGALMSYFGLSDRFIGGKVNILSTQQDSGLIEGKITVDKTELNEPGFLLQALSILGIVDAIRGKNMVFDEINIPFQLLPEGELKMSDAYAAGSSLGVTFHGTVNLDNLDIEGAVIPAYAVNSLPGKIPLIGALFREGDGGGLIGVKYSIKGGLTEPDVEFHPLSSIMPGALGYIF